jgi:hypothetical protein
LCGQFKFSLFHVRGGFESNYDQEYQTKSRATKGMDEAHGYGKLVAGSEALKILYG